MTPVAHQHRLPGREWTNCTAAVAREQAAHGVETRTLVDQREVERHGIYTASKTHHAPKWIALRAQGLPIISTWIDEWEPDASKDLPDLWVRCLSESASCEMLLLYVEPGDVLKGAHAEAGVALSRGIPVHYVGPAGLFSMLSHPLVRRFETINAALTQEPAP